MPLPTDLRAAVADFAESSDGSVLSGASRNLSNAYRDRRTSRDAVRLPSDVAAYLLTRLPATYAAVESALQQLRIAVPKFAPTSILDLGCGPGTAGWAAANAFPSIEHVTMVDANPRLLDAARTLAAQATSRAIAEATVIAGDLRSPPNGQFDLVVLSYALTELSDEVVVNAVEAGWSRCSGALIVVEPGTPRDYARVMDMRGRLLAAGATMAAPCPHECPCPLTAPDWCHFSVRLPRTREHRQLKSGTLGYEDEKFSYLSVVRPSVPLARATARVLARPRESKFDLTLKLCREDGTASERRALKRDKQTYRAVRRLDWGDGTDS